MTTRGEDAMRGLVAGAAVLAVAGVLAGGASAAKPKPAPAPWQSPLQPWYLVQGSASSEAVGTVMRARGETGGVLAVSGGLTDGTSTFRVSVRLNRNDVVVVRVSVSPAAPLAYVCTQGYRQLIGLLRPYVPMRCVAVKP